MNRKKVTKMFYLPTQVYYAMMLLLLVVIMSFDLDTYYKGLIGGLSLAIGIIPLILYKNIKRNLKPYGNKYIYYGYELALFILPVLVYFASAQNKVVEIIAIVFYVLAHMYTNVMQRLFQLSEEKITSILPEVKKNKKLKLIISSIFLTTFILLNLWFGYIKPEFIKIDVMIYEYIFIFVILISVLVLEYKKIMTVPNKNSYYVSLVLLVIYLAVPQLYLDSYRAVISYTVIYLIGYISLYIFEFEEFPFSIK